MTFSFPAAFWLLALMPLLFIFHFYRVERTTKRMTTLAFWPTNVRQQGAQRAALSRFRPSLLWLLQLLSFIALVITLANPQFDTQVSGSKHLIIALDDSLSMRTEHQGITRYSLAKNAAHEQINALKPGQKALLLTVQRGIVVPFTEDKSQLLAHLETLHPQNHNDADIWQTIQALSATLEATGVHFFTDGALQPPDSLELKSAFMWHIFGTPADNVAITRLNARTSPKSPDQTEVFLRIHNFSAIPKQTPLTIRVNGAITTQTTIDVPNNGNHSLVFPVDNSRDVHIEAYLADEDAFSGDDKAQLKIAARKPLRIALITPGNLFLERALAVEKNTFLETFPPSTEEHVIRGLSETFDLVVFDTVPVPQLDRGRYLFIRTLPPEAPLQALDIQPTPTPVNWSANHPITQAVSFDNVLIKETLAVRPNTGVGDVLVESERTPLIYSWSQNAMQAVFIGFDLLDSDLRIQVTFPVLMNNIVAWLTMTNASAVFEPLDGLNPNNPFSLQESNLHTATNPSSDIGNANTQRFNYRQPIWRWFVVGVLLLLLIESALFWRRLPVDRRTYPRIAFVFVPMIATLGLLGTALLHPFIVRLDDTLHITLLVDESDSARHFQRPLDTTKLGNNLHEGDSLREIQFATTPHQMTENDPTPHSSDPVSDGNQTNIEAAFNVALATGPTNQAQRWVLVSDGNQTRGDALRGARHAKRQGIPIDTLTRPIENVPETVLHELHTPDEVREGETYSVRIIASATAETATELILRRNGQIVVQQAITLEPGNNAFGYTHHAEQPGYQVYQAELRPDADTVAVNNTTLRTVAVHPQAQILMLDSEPEASEPFAAALAAQGIHIDVVGPQLVTERLAELNQYDALILSNLSSLHLSRAQMERIRAYVHDSGGGLAMLGGDRSFGLGGYYKTPVETALPVTMLDRQRLDVPSTSVVLVIDRSGSMNRSDGEFNRLELAKEAAQRAAGLLKERSELGVLAFDMKSQWVVPLGPLEDREATLNAIATMRAGGGGTQMLWGLEKAYRSIARRKTAIRHIIILSDGEVYSSRFPELLKKMVRKNITVSAVTIASQTGVSQLRNIAQMGKGRFYFTEDASKLPRIFTMETQLATKSSLFEKSFTPVATNRLHEIMRGFDWHRPPALGGYVATTAKHSAQTLLRSPQGDPIIAVWHYGLGRAGVFTSELKTRWGNNWLEWKNFSALGATFMRWLLRPDSRRDVFTRTAFTDETGKIIIDVGTKDGQYHHFLQGSVAVVHPDQSQEIVPLVQDAPGRYVGQFSPSTNGAHLLGVSLHQEDRQLPGKTTQLVRSYDPEYQYRHTQPNLPLLRQLATLTDGTVEPVLEHMFDGERRMSQSPWPLWPWLVAIAFITLIMTAAARWLSDKYRLWERPV